MQRLRRTPFLEPKYYILSISCSNAVLKIKNNSESNDTKGEGLQDDEYLKKLPIKLQSSVNEGNRTIKEIEDFCEILKDSNDKFQAHLSYYLYFLFLVFSFLTVSYFFNFKLLIDTVVGVLLTIVVELLLLFKFDVYNLKIPNIGENWKKFTTLFLYDLGNISPFFGMIAKRSEHEQLISQFKRKSLYVLRRFGLLEMPEIERTVESFDSISDDERFMINSLTMKIEKLGINKNIFELFYYEFPIPNNGEILQEIKDDPVQFQLLLNILIGTEKIKINSESPFDLDILSSTLKSAINFNLDEIRSKFTSQTNDIRKVEEKIMKLIGIYFHKHPIPNINNKIKFKSVSSMNVSYIEALSEVYQVDSDVLKYLLYSLEPSADGEEFTKSFNNHNHSLEKLSKFLLDEGVIMSNSTPQELVEILRSISRFSPEALQIKISDYEESLSFTREFRDFIVRTGAINKNTPLTINGVFEICNQVTNRIERLFHLAGKIMEEFEIVTNPSVSLERIQKEATSESFLAIFLYRKQSPFLGKICKNISLHRNSVGILYDYAVQSDRESMLSEDFDKLIPVTIANHDQDKTEQERYYYKFKEKLEQGILYTNIKQLDSYIMTEIKEQLTDLGSTINDISTLNVFKKSLKEILDSELIETKIESLLDYGTVNAFLLTKDPKSGGNVLPFVDKISEENKIMLYTGSGDHTRFGMIPLGRSFAEFSDYFENLYNKEASKKENQNILSSTTLNIYKLVPSKSFTKVIGISSKSAVLEAISIIIKDDKFPENDKITILASLTGESDSRRSVGHIFTKAVDSIDIIDFAIEKAEIEQLSFSVLSKISLDNRLTFNRGLLRHFSAQSISAFAKFLYKNAVNNKDKIFKDFRNEVFKALNRSNLTNEFEKETEFLFDKLISLGNILDAI